jgi:hypothetical protein
VIVCKQCGYRNQDSDTFCGSCGKFLEWTGERVAVAEAPPPPPAPVEPEPEPARAGLIDRVRQAVGLDDAGRAQVTAPENTASQPAPAEAAPATPAPVVAGAPAALGAADKTSRPPSAPPLRSAPVTTQAAGPASAPAPAPLATTPVAVAAEPAEHLPSGEPASRAPSKEEPVSRRPTAVAPVRKAPLRPVEAPTRREPGDLICGQCGEGNDPIRHFCRRCGASLDEAAVVRLPWYRRLWNRLFPKRSREAGWRPKRAGSRGLGRKLSYWFRVGLGMLAIVAVLLFALLPGVRQAVMQRANSTIHTLIAIFHPTYSQRHAVSIVASSNIAGHPAGLAIDDALNTYWAARVRDTQPSLTVNFGKDPVDLAALVIDNGASGATPDVFTSQPRAKQLHLIFSNGMTEDVSLQDQSTQQTFRFDEKGVTTVKIVVLSEYPPLQGQAVSSVAISNVEFDTKD